MAHTKNSKHEEKSGIHPVVAGIAGAVVGAGVAAVATAALTDEKTKEKMTDVMHTVKDQAMNYVDGFKEKVHLGSDKNEAEKHDNKKTKAISSKKDSK